MDQLSKANTPLAIINALRAGCYTLAQISAALAPRNYLRACLSRQHELRLVGQRLPVSAAPAQRRHAKSARYALADPHFRFQFRRAYRDGLPLRREQLLPAVQDNLRGFVRATPFEKLRRQ